MRAAPFGSLALALLLLASCKDAGDETLAKVKTQYAQLLEAGTPAQSRDFDAVLQTLASIPPRSHARPEADQLVHAITAARGGVVRRPLAVVAAPLPDLGAPQVQAQLETTRAECERLAQELGTLQGDARAKKLEVLDACRRRADDLADALAHSEGDGGAR